MSTNPGSPPRGLRVRPASRRSGLWAPALISTLALTLVIGGITVSQFYWSDLRSSMGRMDETVDHARERQRRMVEHFSQAQGLLLAQQQRLQAQEESLRTREAKLDAERAELEETRARLGIASASRAALDEQDRARELAWRLDLGLSALQEPGGLDSISETLAAIADWATASPEVKDSTLAPTLQTALSESQAALAKARGAGPHPLAGRVERLGDQAAALDPGPEAPGPGEPASGLAAHAGAGHLGEQLEIALFALHRGDEALFRLALDTAAAWLAAFYDPADPAVQAVQSEIAALGALPITQELSPLRTGLVRLRAVLGELIQVLGSGDHRRALHFQ